MPSPQFTFRLPQKDKEALTEMAAIYGAPSPGAFCAAMVGALCSGDLERIKAFNARLVKGMGEQLTLKLNASMDAIAAAEKPAKQATKRTAKGKGRSRA